MISWAISCCSAGCAGRRVDVVGLVELLEKKLMQVLVRAARGDGRRCRCVEGAGSMSVTHAQVHLHAAVAESGTRVRPWSAWWVTE